jgi:hypothetical protein
MWHSSTIVGVAATATAAPSIVRRVTKVLPTFEPLVRLKR